MNFPPQFIKVDLGRTTPRHDVVQDGLDFATGDDYGGLAPVSVTCVSMMGMGHAVPRHDVVWARLDVATQDD
jgi:hypothetical protein